MSAWRPTPVRLLLALPILALAGCGSDDSATSPSVETTGPAPATTSAPLTTGPDTIVVETVAPTVPPETPTAGAVGSDEEQAIADLAASQGVDPAAITTLSVENVTWPDGSIGCPEPGVNYTQALVDGVRVVLELDGARYEYHAGGGQGVFYCADPQPPTEG